MTTAAITEAITNEINALRSMISCHDSKTQVRLQQLELSLGSELLLGSAGCIRGIAKTLRAKALPYEVVRVNFKLKITK